MAGKKKKAGQEMLDALIHLSDTLDAGKKLETAYTIRSISLKVDKTEYGPDDVKQTRKKLNLSQAVFAMLLGVSPSAVRAWERGAKAPASIACRFMDEINHDPEHWNARIKELVVVK